MQLIKIRNIFSQSRSLLDGQDYDLYTTSKNLTELLAVTTRGPEPPLSIEDALAVIEDYSSALSILFPNDQSFTTYVLRIQKRAASWASSAWFQGPCKQM